MPHLCCEVLKLRLEDSLIKTEECRFCIQNFRILCSKMCEDDDKIYKMFLFLVLIVIFTVYRKRIEIEHDQKAKLKFNLFSFVSNFFFPMTKNYQVMQSNMNLNDRCECLSLQVKTFGSSFRFLSVAYIILTIHSGKLSK